MKKSAIGWVIAGATAVVGGVGVWLYERSKPAPAPATPATPASSTTSTTTTTIPAAPASTMPPAVTGPQTPTPLTQLPAGTLTHNYYYAFSALLPAGIATPQTFYDAIGQAGWVNQRILWFGPTGYIDHAAGLIDGPTVNPSQLGPTSVVAFGQWSGADGIPMPNGVNFYRAG